MIQAIVLGLVQGLTEFLPVSSSGHLVVVPYLFGWDQPTLAFDVALHAGTLLALIAYFAGDLWYLMTRPFGIGAATPGEAIRARRTLVLLALATAPAAVAGITLEQVFERAFLEPRLVGALLVVTAGLLYLAEHMRHRRAVAAHGPDLDDPALDIGRDESTVGVLDALTVGAFQALSILPGLSRSGATIVGGMLRGLSREAAARFSFLMAIPVIAGASASQARELVAGAGQPGSYTGAELAVGVAVAALSGYWAIRFLLRLVATTDLLGFARYVGVLGVLTVFGTFWLGPASSV